MVSGISLIRKTEAYGYGLTIFSKLAAPEYPMHS